MKKKELDKEELTLESCFVHLLNTFETLPAELRGKRLRFAMEQENLSNEFVKEFVDIFASEGLQPDIKNKELSTSEPFFPESEECTCTVCPVRDKLQQDLCKFEENPSGETFRFPFFS